MIFTYKIVIENGIVMFDRDEPYIVTIEEKFDAEEHGELHFNDMSRLLMEMTEDTPDKTINIMEH